MLSLAIFDLDGTLYRGAEPTPDAVETVRILRNRGVKVRFLTNNSGRSQQEICDKLYAMGFETELNEVYTSAMGAASYCQAKGVRTAFVIGESGLKEALRAAGLVEAESSPDAVVAGICRQFTYNLLRDAQRHILGGARFIATNTDATYPLEQGRLEPGAGAIIAALTTCTGVNPTTIGKPEPYLIQTILDDCGLKPTEALVVGDRIETDILAGQRAGCQVHLVMCGTTTVAPDDLTHSDTVAGVLDRF